MGIEAFGLRPSHPLCYASLREMLTWTGLMVVLWQTMTGGKPRYGPVGSFCQTSGAQFKSMALRFCKQHEESRFLG